MALDTQYPSWLRDQQNFMMESGERSTQNFVQSLFEAKRLGMEQQQNRLLNASRLLGLEQQDQEIQLNTIRLGNYAKDQTEIPQWLQQHPTWESRQDAQWPTALSPEGQRQLNDVRMRDASSVQQKAAVAAVSEFSKRVDALSKVDPISAGQFAPYIGKANPSPQILQALGIAEQAVGVRQQNEKEQAEMAAAARGDVATTRITPKGVETTYKPAPPISKTTQFKPEEPINLQDGAQLIHVSPNRWQYVKGDKQFDLNAEGRRRVAHEILALNPKDPRGLTILDELADMADKSAKADTSTATPAPTNTFKVGDFNVRVK